MSKPQCQHPMHDDDCDCRHPPICEEPGCSLDPGFEIHCDEHRPDNFADPDGYVWKRWAMAWFDPSASDP